MKWARRILRVSVGVFLVFGTCARVFGGYDHRLDRVAAELRATSSGRALYSHRWGNGIDVPACRLDVIDEPAPLEISRAEWARRMFAAGMSAELPPGVRGVTVIQPKPDQLDGAAIAEQIRRPTTITPAMRLADPATSLALATSEGVEWRFGHRSARLVFAVGHATVTPCQQGPVRRFVAASGHTIVAVFLYA
ncbi:MAG TPA: hypothetical protein VHD87_15070 [Acidimicrobiales bacterium]|nr:hypothetical protein [Acidimicrobiales bacterium]